MHRQIDAQADRVLQECASARRRSWSVKRRAANKKPQKEKKNNMHNIAWYIGKDSKLKTSNNMADEAAAMQV